MEKKSLKEIIEESGGLSEVVNNPVVKKDLSHVSFDKENLNDGEEDWLMPGYEPGYKNVEGVEVLFAAGGGDSQKPVAFVIYQDAYTGKLRGYMPCDGNSFDKDHNKAWDGEDESEYGFSMEKMTIEITKLFRSISYFHNSRKVPVLGFKIVHPDAKLPTYAHEGDAGMDVYAVEDIEIKPYVPTIVHTGLVAEIPKGYELQVRSRSGLAAKHGVFVLNSPGTIDQGYKGEIGVVLFWAPPIPDAISCMRDDCGVHVRTGYNTHSVLKGDRIAQLVLSPVTPCTPVEIEDVGDTERGTGGFGSTGK